MKRVVIVVPIYAPLNKYEAFSITNLNKVLKSYDKIVVCPKGFSVDLLNYTDETYRIIELPKKFFKSPQTYNKLLRTKKFFKLFKDYEFMLMHHLDAFVFRDELDYWCDMGFDYIGAPFYEFNGLQVTSCYVAAGNGGFSLHKIQSALDVLSTFKVVYPLNRLCREFFIYNWKGRIAKLPYFLKMFFGIGRNSHFGLNQSALNEDVFWSMLVPNRFKTYKVAEYSDALKFSFEYNCAELFKENSNSLPFGCHGWFKDANITFWKELEIFNRQF